MNANTGKWIILLGLVVILIGMAIYFFHDKLHWIGRLPGDIRVEKENFRFYFPITTMVIFSAVVSLLIYLIRNLFH
jgi:hypothetical protein